MTKEIPEHKDKLGRPLKLDDIVAFPTSNSLEIGKIIKINPKMIKVEKIPAGRWGSTWNKYSSEMVLIDGADLTLYLLTAKQ